MPSGAFSISMPSAVTVARPDTSSSTIVSFGPVQSSDDWTCPNASGSKSRRSVKRQCSEVVSGSGSFSYAASASLRLIRRVPLVQREPVAIGIEERRHVANARVDGLAVELDALRLELGARGLDVGDVEQRDRVRLRLVLLAPLAGHPDRESTCRPPELGARVRVGP